MKALVFDDETLVLVQCVRMHVSSVFNLKIRICFVFKIQVTSVAHFSMELCMSQIKKWGTRIVGFIKRNQYLDGNQPHYQIRNMFFPQSILKLVPSATKKFLFAIKSSTGS